jgi:hypothetical protein
MTRPDDDLEWIRADDLLLDALGRGEPGPDDDEVAAMLAAWHADLAEELPTVRAAITEEATIPIQGVPARKRFSRPRLIAVAATVTLIAALGGVFVAALNATPGSPLWPISQILNPDRADVLAARDAIHKVRVAIDQQRYGDATRLIPHAQVLIDKVQDSTQQEQLQAELNALVQELAAKVGGAGTLTTPGPSVGASPTPAPTQAPGPGGSGAGGGGAPGQQRTPGGGGGVLPPSLLPSLPLPSLPLPKLPLPSLPLPSLPIHL